MEILVTERGGGKTTELMKWVQTGEKIHRYPGWNKIAIISTREMYDVVKTEWWSQIDDFDHRVYFFEEVSGNRYFWNRYFWNNDVEARIDDAELLFYRVLPGVRVTGFTASGESWKLHLDGEKKW